jgi:hypothetical protein
MADAMKYDKAMEQGEVGWAAPPRRSGIKAAEEVERLGPAEPHGPASSICLPGSQTSPRHPVVVI